MASSTQVRIVFVGVGFMGQCAHLRNYATLPDCRVTALAELREKTGRTVAQRYGVPKVYTTAKQMLASEDFDAIVACQKFARHGLMLKELAQAGKPIFIEKPLALSVAVGQEILKYLDTSGAKLMVGYHKRSDLATEYAKAEIDRLQTSRELGQMKYIRILMPAGDWVASGNTDLINVEESSPIPALQQDPPPTDMDEETRKKYTSFVNYYIHQVNLMRHLLGEPYKITYAEPSGVLLVGRSASGIACTIEMSPYRTSIDWQESILVCFEHGYVRLDLPAPLACNRPGAVEVFKDPGQGVMPTLTRPRLPWVHAMRRQAENFLRFVRGEAPATCGAAEALEDLKLARDYIRILTGK